METLVVAAGCFWCTEAIFVELNGVHKVESGYTGGSLPNPTYKQVCSGTTGHAEGVRIEFDPTVVSRADLLRIFFVTHDPTSLNRQGGDVGTQYRSAIFYANDAEKQLAIEVINELTREAIFDQPIVTTLEPLSEFFVAEPEHLNYFERFENAGALQKITMNAGYCSAVIAPKVAKFRKEYSDRLRSKKPV